MDTWTLLWQQLPQQLVNSLWLGGVYALFALGYTLVFGVIKELNLAHGGIFMWGAFTGLLCVTFLKIPVFLALVVAMAAAGICGILLERLAYKPLRQLSKSSVILWAGFLLFLFANFRLFPSIINRIIGGCGIVIMLAGLILDLGFQFPGIPRDLSRGRPRERDELAPLISSIGAASILVSLSQATFGAQQSRFPVDSFPHIVFLWGPVSVTLLQLIIFILSLLLMSGLSWYVFRSKTGRGLRAVACNPKVASLLGVHVDKIYLQTFFFSSALAGAAGVLHGLAFNAITPYMGAPVQLKGLTVIVLGGMGNIAGAVVGGFIVAILEVFSVATGQSNFRDAIVFLLLFMILLIRPRGLLGGRGVDKV